jgi:sulfate permease, SulP family
MNTNQYLTEIISGLTISLLMIPEAIAFAFILGFPPSVGLHSTMIVSLITSLFGGCPALISGSTAAVATSLIGIKEMLGQEYIFLAVIMGGILQIIMGVTGIYKYIYNISKSVSSGFLIALGVLIGLSQLQHFKDTKTGNWFSSDELFTTVFFSLISIIIAEFGLVALNFSKLLNIKIPGGLISIILLSLLFYVIPYKLPIQFVGDKGDVKNTIPSFKLPKVEWNFINIIKALPFAIAMAIAGLTESIFMVKETSSLLNINASAFQETIAQGIANIVSGIAGGMGGCVLVGQSKYNLENGSKTRLSSLCTSLFFIIFTLFLSSSIEKIPMPAIIGIMLAIAFKTGDWMSLFKKIDKSWIVIAITSIVGISTSSLALAIIIGSILQKLI